MALVWTTVLYDRSGGGVAEVDITGRHLYDTSQFQSAGQATPGTGLLDLSFLYLESWTLQQGMVWAAGFRDDSSGAWALQDAAGDPALVYGGYVTAQTGGATGPYHTLKQTLATFDWDFDTTDIIVWPDLAAYPTPYPDGYSATDWLVGTVADGRPFNGLIPARLGSTGGYLLDGVESVFDSIIFAYPGVKPGVAMTDAPLNGGLWGFVDLRSALDDVCAGIRGVDDTLEPVFWVDTAIDPADPTQIRPRFRLANRAETTGLPAATFVGGPVLAAPGEWQIEEPFSHIITAPGSQQRVVVWGPWPYGQPPQYGLAYDPGRPVQPTVYQTDPGRSGKPFFSEDIRSAAHAQAEAERIEAQAWAPARTLRFRTRRPTLPGELVWVRIPPEGLDEAFRVTEVSTVPGVIRKYDVTIGRPMPDFNAQMQRRARKDHALQQLAALGQPLPGGQTGAPGATRRIPLHSTPQNPNSTENIIKPGANDTVGLTLQGNAQDRDPLNPVDPASYAPAFQVKPPATALVPDPAAATWTSQGDGRPHPQVYPMGFSADGSTDRIVVPWDMRITRIKVKGTGTATLNKNGVAAAGPFSPAGGWQAISPAITYSEVADDDWSVTASGVSGFLAVAVSEP